MATGKFFKALLVDGCYEQYVAFSSDGQVLSSSSESSGKKMVLRLEHNSMQLMTELMSKFSWANELMPDTSAGALATTKACLQFLEHCRFFS